MAVPGSAFTGIAKLRATLWSVEAAPAFKARHATTFGNLAIRLAKAVNNHSIPLLARLSVEASLPWGEAVADALRRR